jgi:serine/threonine protein kinase
MVSKDAVDFVRALLNRDPLARPTAAQALQHPWIAPHIVQPGIPPPRPFSSFSFSKSFSNSDGFDRPASISTESSRCIAFRKYMAASKMRKAMTRASMGLTPHEASLLGEVFAKVDQDMDGTITTSDLDRALKAPTFSSVVRRNLKQMKSHLIRYPSVKFDIRPFVPIVKRRAQTD